jgi:hypothetical protein
MILSSVWLLLAKPHFDEYSFSLFVYVFVSVIGIRLDGGWLHVYG